MGRGGTNSGSQEQNQLYTRAVTECSRMLDRLTAGYEADLDKRRDLRQEIHLQLWRSFRAFDGRCSLKTWTLRVAHNTAASYVVRERRMNAKLVSLEVLPSPIVAKPPDALPTRETDHPSRFEQREYYVLRRRKKQLR